MTSVLWLRVCLGVFAVTCAACSSPSAAPPTPAPSSTSAPWSAPPSAREERAYPTACDSPTTLDVHTDPQGFVDRIHANLVIDDQVGPFLVDTGSVKTFVAT